MGTREFERSTRNPRVPPFAHSVLAQGCSCLGSRKWKFGTACSSGMIPLQGYLNWESATTFLLSPRHSHKAATPTPPLALHSMFASVVLPIWSSLCGFIKLFILFSFSTSFYLQHACLQFHLHRVCCHAYMIVQYLWIVVLLLILQI